MEDAFDHRKSVLTVAHAGMPQGTSVDQAVEELDNLQSQLDTGNSELIREDSFLVQLLSRDAAGLLGHPVRFIRPTLPVLPVHPF